LVQLRARYQCAFIKQLADQLFCSPVLHPDNPPKRIIIHEVTHYAYGQTEDKSIQLWVAGKAGWYDIISPAKGFTPTYNRMVQAIDLLYFLVDKHQQGKKLVNPSFRSLCEQVSLSMPSEALNEWRPNVYLIYSTFTTHTAHVRPESSQRKYLRSTLLFYFVA
jgi:hypothetical protein